VTAEIDVINESWNVDSSSNNVADSIGLMVYEGTQALQYVKNFAQGADQWEGFPIKVRLSCKNITHLIGIPNDCINLNLDF
jgi:hypothetical protein